MSGTNEALKASIKALGGGLPVHPSQQVLAGLEGVNKVANAAPPSRGLALIHSRYPKETEAALRKLGFTHVGDPDSGLAGPGALVDLVASKALSVTPLLAVVSGDRNGWEASAAGYDRKNQVVKWLLNKPPNQNQGDENLENINRVRTVWDKTFADERKAFAALGPDYWDKTKPAIYEAHQEIVKRIMAADVVMAQAGIYTGPQTAPAQQKAGATRAAPAPTDAPNASSSASSGASPTLKAGTPEFEQEKQRRLAYWKQKATEQSSPSNGPFDASATNAAPSGKAK